MKAILDPLFSGVIVYSERLTCVSQSYWCFSALVGLNGATGLKFHPRSRETQESQRLEHGATLLEVFVWREQVMVLAVGGGRCDRRRAALSHAAQRRFGPKRGAPPIVAVDLRGRSVVPGRGRSASPHDARWVDVAKQIGVAKSCQLEV